MEKITFLKKAIFFTLLLSVCLLYSQERIAVIQDSKVLLLDNETGAIIDPSFILLGSGTPKGIIQVNEEIWISYQLDDKIERYSIEGVLIGSINSGLDNIRGLSVINNSEVWVTNDGTDNGAPGSALVRFDFSGNNLGFIPTRPESESPFDVIDNGAGEVYISYITTDNIERRDYTGSFIGNIVEFGVVNFIQQLEVEEPGILLAAVFSDDAGSGNSKGLYRFSIADGSILDYWNLGNLRGVAKLGNGEILFSSGAGVFRLDPNTGTDVMISEGSAQYFGRLDLSIAGISDFNDHNFKFYPNPTTEIFILEHTASISDVTITNLLGQNIIHLKPNSPKVELNLADFPNGIYLVTVKSNQNTKTIKVIKQ